MCFLMEPQPLSELFVISMMAGNTPVDLMKVATKKVFVTPNVVLVFSKCAV